MERQQDGGEKEGSMADLETEEHRSWWRRICGFFWACGRGLWKREKRLFFVFFVSIVFRIVIAVIFLKYVLFKNLSKLLHIYGITINILPDQDPCGDRWNGQGIFIIYQYKKNKVDV